LTLRVEGLSIISVLYVTLRAERLHRCESYQEQYTSVLYSTYSTDWWSGSWSNAISLSVHRLRWCSNERINRCHKYIITVCRQLYSLLLQKERAVYRNIEHSTENQRRTFLASVISSVKARISVGNQLAELRRQYRNQ